MQGWPSSLVPAACSTSPDRASLTIMGRTVCRARPIIGISSETVFQPSPGGRPFAIICCESSAAQPWSEAAEIARDVETPVDLFRLVDLVGSIFKEEAVAKRILMPELAGLVRVVRHI